MTVEKISLNVSTNAGGAAKKFASLSAAIEGVQSAAKSSFGGVDKSIKGLTEETKRANKHMSKLAASLGRIAMYRALRTILKEISQGFQEGLRNAYHFSKGISGELARALDELAVKSLTMKNQMGAAFGELLQTLMPIILRIVDLIRRLMAALSALSAALGGRDTYKVAIDTATEWDKATGAAKKYKNTILGFDEINRLDEPSGGGGGSNNPLGDFKDAELPEWAKWVKDHLEEIKRLAIAIGTAIAAWKIGGFIKDLLDTNSNLKTTIGYIMAIAGFLLLLQGSIGAIRNGMDWNNLFEMLIGAALLVGGLTIAFGELGAKIGLVAAGVTVLGVSFYDAFNNGVDWDNLVGMLAGTAMAAIGLALAFGAVGAAIGFVVGGVALLVSGFNDWIKTGKLSEKSFWAIEAGIMAVGVGISLLTGSWIPLVIAAVAGIVLAIVTHWDEIKKWTVETWNKVKESISNSVKETKEKIIEIWGKIKNFFQETIPQIINKVSDWFNELPYKIGYALGFAFNRFLQWGYDVRMWVNDKITEIVHAIEDWFAELPEKLKETFNKTTEKLGEWKDNAIIFVKEKVPEIISKIEEFFLELPEKVFNIGKNIINRLWDGISEAWNWVKGKVQGIGDNISNSFSDFGAGFNAGYNSVPIEYHAVGGTIPNNGTLFVAGEAGAEIVTNMGSGRTGVTNVEQMEAAVAGGNAGVINAIYNLIDAVNNKDTDVVLDGQSMARALYRPMQQETKRRGSNLVQGSVYA